MKAIPEIKSMFSADIDLESWSPTSLEQVFFTLQLELGLPDDDRADVFQLTVATPEGLRQKAANYVVSERATLVVSDYSKERLCTAINHVLKKCHGRNWSDNVSKLQRYFLWEYEDYGAPKNDF